MMDQTLITILNSYGIEQPVITFLRHNENRTYRVEDSVKGQVFLLRIHQPLKPSMSGLQHTYDGMLGELEMLEKLAEAGILRAQKPLRNRGGDLITVIEQDGEELNCSVMTWLEGRDLQKKDLSDPVVASRLGAQIAKLHAFLRQYRLANPDQRPSQGIEYNNQLVAAIRQGLELGLFTSEDVQVIEDSIQRINARLEEQENKAEAWGLVHGDLNLGNVILMDDGAMSIIDFGFFGPGYYLIDVAMGAMMVPAEQREVFLEGYYGEAGMPEKDIVLLEGFMLTAIIGYYAFQMGNESVHPWMRERMPMLCEKHCLPFLAGERIWLNV
ncbi:phosphotransferase enzyme family protein [Paenibacillus dakarensis]|uniref:phosphotransferase enzyme family protein n=1 Tax=Paenibacillus dakarensis TaxID=1527293 RepID=UPI0006D582F0|nr:aminoglycoside phosphotransferase family protein [Paenibacillus dakarensis]